MPYTILHWDHLNSTLERHAQAWDDRQGAAKYVCELAEEMALGIPGLMEPDRVVLLRAAAAAAVAGYFVFDPVLTWAVVEIDRPDQPLWEFADRAIALVTHPAGNHTSREEAP